MKKAVISTGGKQYIVKEGETLEVERIKSDKATVSFTPLLIFENEKVVVGQPEVDGAKVTAKIVEETKADKVTSIRYKAKKRVNKVRGHRQIHTKLSIEKISSK